MFKCFMNVEKLAYTEDSPAAAEAWHELVGLWALIESLNDFKDEVSSCMNLRLDQLLTEFPGRTAVIRTSPTLGIKLDQVGPQPFI